MRFEVRPSTVTEGRWVVVDTLGDELVRRTKTGPVAEDHAKMAAFADRMNAKIDARKICQKCRHKTPALEVKGGKCPACRQEEAELRAAQAAHTRRNVVKPSTRRRR